ncbi:hypothetical protein G6O67_004828 [Ophiocordyceps sinensis]|uniref:Uncharacterized protein n=1 Tax=Ophiocordyceps sinensis TaxID=72228 RepID=A0A8H4PQB3_9HYPO|nr:hypothetical protein G6O67_004828 [Ophiocordyceps sinensis]
MKPSALVIVIIATATAPASLPPRSFPLVPLPPPLDWMPSPSLLAEHVLASHHADYAAHASGESWARDVVGLCERDPACTSTFSFSAINAGSPRARYWFAYTCGGGPTTPANYTRDLEGLQDTIAHSVVG